GHPYARDGRNGARPAASWRCTWAMRRLGLNATASGPRDATGSHCRAHIRCVGASPATCRAGLAGTLGETGMQNRFGVDVVPHRCRRLRLAVAIALATSAGLAAGAPQDAQPDAAATQGAIELDRVIVTAAKREQSVREVPASVSAITQQQLQDQGAQSLADYVQKTPGVVFNSYQPGVSHVVVRGISTSAGNPQGQPTTGYFLNDVPLIEPGWTIAIPDIDAFDLNRVEVLRGPQGSLFGSAS